MGDGVVQGYRLASVSHRLIVPATPSAPCNIRDPLLARQLCRGEQTQRRCLQPRLIPPPTLPRLPPASTIPPAPPPSPPSPILSSLSSSLFTGIPTPAALADSYSRYKAPSHRPGWLPLHLITESSRALDVEPLPGSPDTAPTRATHPPLLLVACAKPPHRHGSPTHRAME